MITKGPQNEVGWITEILQQKGEVRSAQIALHLAAHILDAYREANQLAGDNSYDSLVEEAEKSVAAAHSDFSLALLHEAEPDKYRSLAEMALTDRRRDRDPGLR